MLPPLCQVTLSAKIFDEVETEGEVVAEEDIAAVLAGADLSEEFKRKQRPFLKAAVAVKVQEQIATIKESTEAKLTEEIESIKEEFAGRVENFLNYACEEWMSENELAIEQGLRAEVTSRLWQVSKTCSSKVTSTSQQSNWTLWQHERKT